MTKFLSFLGFPKRFFLKQCFKERSLHFHDTVCSNLYKFSNNNSLCMVICHEILSDNSLFLKICCLPSPFILCEKKCKEAVNIEPFNKSNIYSFPLLTSLKLSSIAENWMYYYNAVMPTQNHFNHLYWCPKPREGKHISVRPNSSPANASFIFICLHPACI